MQLKLKQASAVLGVAPKDLQNLVQLKVLRPPRRDSVYLFDKKLLLEAKLAFYLKDSLGTPSELLARFTEAFSRDLSGQAPSKRYIWLRSRPARGQSPVDIRIPLRDLARELEEQMPLASIHKDLPRGRKRPGWKSKFLQSLRAAGADLSGVTEFEITQTIRKHRAERRQAPEISIGGSKKRS
jgi:hypothetical protein